MQESYSISVIIFSLLSAIPILLNLMHYFDMTHNKPIMQKNQIGKKDCQARINKLKTSCIDI